MITYAIASLSMRRECAVQRCNTLPVMIDHMTIMVCTHDDVKTKVKQPGMREESKRSWVSGGWKRMLLEVWVDVWTYFRTFPTYLNCSRPPWLRCSAPVLGVLHKNLPILYITRFASNQLFSSYHRGESLLYKDSGLSPTKPNLRF